MSNVTVQIGGRGYIVACAEGEEAHVERLGNLIDDKIRDMSSAGHNEVRLLLFAALLLADELHDRADGKAPPPPPPPPAAQPDVATAIALEAMADRLENLASALERGAADA